MEMQGTGENFGVDLMLPYTRKTFRKCKKMNYLRSCLKGAALNLISGIDVAPENYEIACHILTNKYGDSSKLINLLYNELSAIKRNDKEWIGTVEKMERIFRQLEKLGVNLDHSSTENTIHSRLPLWILDKVYHQRAVDTPWSITKLRKFLFDLINVTEEKNQFLSSLADKKYIPQRKQISKS